MSMITADLHARLTTALGPDIPVLLPEQLRDPLEAAPLDAQGRPSVTGGERGLGAYLKAHPGGYVQIEDERGLMAAMGGAAGIWMLQISCVAPAHTTAHALGMAAYKALITIPGVQQTPFEALAPPATGRLQGAPVWSSTFIINARQGI